MHSMLRIFALGIVLLMFLPVVGIAQPQDHLKCYQVKDPLKVNEDVILRSEQFDGLEEDCKIIGKERFFCGSVEKGDTGIYRDAIDRICYRIECPTRQGQNPVPEDVEVEDQFGIRILTNFNPHYLCTPAFKTGQPCPERAVCGGECTDGGGELQECRPDSVGDCLCIPEPPGPCGDEQAPQCNGECQIGFHCAGDDTQCVCVS